MLCFDIPQNWIHTGPKFSMWVFFIKQNEQALMCKNFNKYSHSSKTYVDWNV